MEQAAASLAASAKQMWTFHRDIGKAELLLAMETSPAHLTSDSKSEVCRGDTGGSKNGEVIAEEDLPVVGEEVLDEWEIIEKSEVSCSVERGVDLESEKCLAKCLVSELLSELVVVAAAEAEARYVERLKVESVERLKQSEGVSGGCVIPDDVIVETSSIVEDIHVSEEIEEAVESDDSVSSVEFEREMARCLAHQLKCEWAVVMATQAQTRYLEVVGKKEGVSESGGHAEVCAAALQLEGELAAVGDVPEVNESEETENFEMLNLEGDLSIHDGTTVRHNSDVTDGKDYVPDGKDHVTDGKDYVTDGKDHVTDGRGQQVGQLVCNEADASTFYDRHFEEESVERMEPDDVLKLTLSSSADAETNTSTEFPLLCDAETSTSTEFPLLCDAETNTSAESSLLCDSETNTVVIPLVDRGSSPAPPPPLMIHAYSQTVLSIEDLEARVKEKEELDMLKVDLHVVRGNLNQERSQRLVSEELVKIIQSDLNTVSSRNTSEVMARLQVENELTEVKGEFSHCQRELKEKKERIEELEDILKGTTLMVRKLEEQNVTTLINRGGIDYMLQARLADGRAKEAEQKLQMLQTELLQSQSEVRMLLDRVSESSRDRAEMVSSKVHNQLISIADEKVVMGERRAQMMEREILELRRRLAAMEGRDGGGHTGLTGLTSSGLTGYASSTMLGGGLTGLGSGLGGGLGSGIGGVGYGLGGLGSGVGGLGYGLGSGLGGMGSGLGGLGSGLGGMGSGLGGMGPGLSGMGSGLGSMGSGLGGMGSGLGGMGSGLGGMGSGLGGMGSGLGGMGSGLGGMGSGLGGMGPGLGGMGSGLGGMGSGIGGMGSGLSGNAGYGSGLGGMGVGSTSMDSSLGMRSGLTGMSTGQSSTSGVSSGLSSAPYSLTSTSSNSSAFNTMASSDSVAPFSSTSSFTISTDGGSGIKSHDAGRKSRDFGSNKASFDSKEKGNGGFTLPSFDASSRLEPDGKPLPRAKQLSGSRGDGSDGDSDSSNWSSSGDEGDGLSADMKPTTHTTLISEWEWRVMKQGKGEELPKVTSSPQLSRKRRPPVPPKPVVFRTVTATGEIHFTVEPPSSFEEPSHEANLQLMQLKKPRGPAGRKVPLRWWKQSLLFT